LVGLPTELRKAPSLVRFFRLPLLGLANGRGMTEPIWVMECPETPETTLNNTVSVRVFVWRKAVVGGGGGGFPELDFSGCAYLE
jgi:hypothetical protein